MIHAEPADALHAARRLVGSALDEAGMAGQVGWDTVAAERFRSQLSGLTRVVRADLDVLDEALGQVGRLG